jgi:hypothetical protein
VFFSLVGIKAYQSPRRVKEMGFLEFNAHFFYVLENFFPFLSRTRLIKKSKYQSGITHSKMREESNIDVKT